jgi:hypothetical protein
LGVPPAALSLASSPRHDVGFSAKDAGGGLFYVHQLEKPERLLGVVKEEIDVGTFTCLAPRGRAEQVEMLNAEPL